jgi:hypothetical protein
MVMGVWLEDRGRGGSRAGDGARTSIEQGTGAGARARRRRGQGA